MFSHCSEVLLWKDLNNGQIKGYDFHRQKPLDEYIVDFYCPELMLVIEIDGITHDYKIEKDKIRQKKLESLGLRFIRFLDADVRNHLEGVIYVIKEWVRKHESQ